MKTKFKNANSRFSAILGVAVLATTFIAIISTAEATAMQSSTSEPRQSPAPWRPAFGSVNKSAVQTLNSQAQSQTQAAVNTPESRSANLAPSLPPETGAFNRQAPNTGGTNPNATANTSNWTRTNPNGQAPSNPQAQTNSPSPGNGVPQAGFRANQNTSIKPGVTKVTKTMSKLPNAAGQIWREYDISPYTSQITTTDRPQKAITEWILRETGTEMWFDEPLGILYANKNQICVYHTPEIHNVIKPIIDRFVRTRGQAQNLDVNLVTVENPNWRSKYYTMLQPIEVKSPGVEAWMVSKENAAILLSQLSQRGDFKQTAGGRLSNHDGQSLVLEKTKPLQFVRSLRWMPNQTPSYQPLLTSLNEGYKLSITTLSAKDNRAIEAVIKCDVDQVEKLNTVKVKVPGTAGGSQTMNLQVPQMVSWRLRERFRWPNDQVLLLSCGVVASPDPTSGSGLRIPGLPQKTNRADALLFVEYRGPAVGSTIPEAIAPLPSRTAQNQLAPLRTP